MNLRAFISLASLLLCYTVTAVTPGPMKVLHADNFMDEINGASFAFVEIAAESQPSEETHFSQVAHLLQDSPGLDVRFFSLRQRHQKRFLKNTDKPEPEIRTPETEIALSYYVKTYPQYVIFKNGGKIAHESHVESGKAAYELVKEYLPKELSLQRLLTVDSSDLEKQTDKYKVSFVARVPADSPVLDRMRKMAGEIPSAGVFMWSPSTEAVNDVLVFRQGEQARGCVGKGPLGEVMEEDLRKCIIEEQSPVFPELSYYKSLGYDQIKSRITVHAQKDWIDANRESLEMIGQSRRSDFRMTWSGLRKRNQIVPGFGTSKHPCALAEIYHPGLFHPRYYAWYHDESVSLYESFNQFTQKVLAKEWPIHYRTDAIPKYNHQSVKKVVAASFDDIVLNSDNDVMIEVWGPNCRMCKSVTRKIEDWAKQMSKVKHVTVARINAAQNDCPMKFCDWSPRTLPQILFFKAKSKKAIQVPATSTLDQLSAIAEENSSRPWRRQTAAKKFDIDQVQSKNRLRQFRKRKREL